MPGLKVHWAICTLNHQKSIRFTSQSWAVVVYSVSRSWHQPCNDVWDAKDLAAQLWLIRLIKSCWKQQFQKGMSIEWSPSSERDGFERLGRYSRRRNNQRELWMANFGLIFTEFNQKEKSENRNDREFHLRRGLKMGGTLLWRLQEIAVKITSLF